MKESTIYDIFELCREYHNRKMTAKPTLKITDEDCDRVLGAILGKICDLYGFDIAGIESICRDIDGCCFEIQQGNTDELGTQREVSDIDHYSTKIQDIVYEIGKLLGNY